MTTSSGAVFTEAAAVEIEPAACRLWLHGFQSWSPTLTTTVQSPQARPGDDRLRDHFWRPLADYPGDPAVWQADGGLLALDPGTGGPVLVAGTPGPDRLPLLRVRIDGRTAIITAGGPVTVDPLPGPIPQALAAWASRWPALPEPDHRPDPGTAWCSWFIRPADTCPDR